MRDACLALHLSRAARCVARSYDAALKPVGLTSGQYSILIALSRPEPPGIGALAAEMAMDRTTLTANLKPLERRGLVKSSADPRDGRSRRLSLTRAGRRAVEQALPLWQQAQDRLLPKLSASLTTYADLRALAGL